MFDISQWLRGAKGRRQSRRYKHISKVCKETNNGEALIVLISARKQLIGKRFRYFCFIVAIDWQSNLPTKFDWIALHRKLFKKYDRLMKSDSLNGACCSYISISSKMLKTQRYYYYCSTEIKCKIQMRKGRATYVT